MSNEMSLQENRDFPANNINYFYNCERREHMFNKVLTPSDVGKLNRLVIPKQHAENYFPLEDDQNGTVFDFQDRNGMVWRIRYSYWTSSQSYVMTKGWNSFVKEKSLEPGDIVSFHRGFIPDHNAPERRRRVMFIDWRHRAEIDPRAVHNINQHNFIAGTPTYPNARFYPPIANYQSFPPIYQEREYLGHGIVNGQPLVYDSVPVFPVPRVPASVPPVTSHIENTVVHESSTTRRLRLFGVDMEESSSSGETRGEMGVVAGQSSSSPVVIRDDDQSPHGEMGGSSSFG